MGFCTLTTSSLGTVTGTGGLFMKLYEVSGVYFYFLDTGISRLSSPKMKINMGSLSYNLAITLSSEL